MSRLVLVHGFTQTIRSWDVVASQLAGDGHDVVRAPLPGHDQTEATDMVEGAHLLGAQGGRAIYVGYSMGGRLCLHLALDNPASVRALILVGTTAGIDDPAERRRRRDEDESLASRLEADGVDAFLADWLARPMFAGLSADAADLDERATNDAAGLAASLRLAGTAAQEPLWDRLGSLEMPVLLVAGMQDAKFRALAIRMADAIGPNAGIALIPDAGHAAHLEQPEAFVAAVRSFVALIED